MDGKAAVGEFLKLGLSSYEGASPTNKPAATVRIADGYYRAGDYENCNLWALKIIDSKELGDAPVSRKIGRVWIKMYKQRLTVAVILANVTAEFGKLGDIEAIENKIPKAEIMSKVLAWFWSESQGDGRLRTMLRLYKALAHKNAGNLNAMKDIAEVSSFNDGVIRIGNKIMPLQTAAKLLK